MQHFEQEIAALKETLLTMASLAEAAVNKAIKALMERAGDYHTLSEFDGDFQKPGADCRPRDKRGRGSRLSLRSEGHPPHRQRRRRQPRGQSIVSLAGKQCKRCGPTPLTQAFRRVTHVLMCKCAAINKY